MIEDHTDRSGRVMRLQAMMAQPRLPQRATRRAASLIDRLTAPVRIGVLGMPSCGKRMIVNALAGTEVLPQGVALPPVELRQGPDARVNLIQADGQSMMVAEALTPDHFGPDVIFATINLPLPTLRGMSLLHVAVEDVGDLDAALRWAAPRCDIALWCTRVWSAAERAIWNRGPDVLKNHALMIALEGLSRLSDHAGAEQGLCAVAIDPVTGRVAEDSAMALRQRLGQMISDARTEDLDAADLLLAQHGCQTDLSTAATGTGVARSKSQIAVAGDAPDSGPPGTVSRSAPDPVVRSDLPPQAVAALSRVFLHLRQGAARIRDALPEQSMTAKATERMLKDCEDTFESLLGIAEDEPCFTEVWPELGTTLQDATELMLLLRIEGGGARAREAAVLMGQVRQEVESALAA